jgi:hypothetical protein
MSSAWVKGCAVGFVNVVVIAFAMAMFVEGAPTLDVFVTVNIIGFLPGVLCGAIVGHLAAQAQRIDRRVVLVVMIAAACGVVAMLGNMFGMTDLVPYACIPTAASCAVLERWTRKQVDPIPLARVA